MIDPTPAVKAYLRPNPSQPLTQTQSQPNRHTACLGLGSNLGNRQGYLDAACSAIAALPGCSSWLASPVYETPPMGPQDQGEFLNMAVRFQTTMTPSQLLEALQQIETTLGRGSREDRQQWGPREIDLDILLFDDRVIDQPGLTLPHPGLAERWFVLKPLADIAPELRHPVLGQSIAELLTSFEARQKQEARR